MFLLFASILNDSVCFDVPLLAAGAHRKDCCHLDSELWNSSDLNHNDTPVLPLTGILQIQSL